MASLPYSRWQKRKKNRPNRSINNVDVEYKAKRPMGEGVIMSHLSSYIEAELLIGSKKFSQK